MSRKTSGRVYWGSLLLIALVSLGILGLFLSGLKALVDLATTLSFLTAPVLALLNHRAMTAGHVPPEARPSRAMVVFSWAGIGFLGAVAAAWIVLLVG